MDRLRRRLINLFVAMSALLFLATVGLWLFCQRTAAEISLHADDRILVAVSEKNLISVRFFNDSQGAEHGWTAETYPNPDYVRSSGLWDELRNPSTRGIPYLGIACSRGLTATNLPPGVSIPGWRPWKHGNRSIFNLYSPHWLIALFAAVAPSVWLFQFRRARRLARNGHCSTCGYDLRATPDRCPECGTIPTTVKSPP